MYTPMFVVVRIVRKRDVCYTKNGKCPCTNCESSTIRMNSLKKKTNLTILNRTSLELSRVCEIKYLHFIFFTAKRNFNGRVMTSVAQDFHRQLAYKTYRDQPTFRVHAGQIYASPDVIFSRCFASGMT